MTISNSDPRKLVCLCRVQHGENVVGCASRFLIGEWAGIKRNYAAAKTSGECALFLTWQGFDASRK